jgi:parallel beta-helix repeat protein
MNPLSRAHLLLTLACTFPVATMAAASQAFYVSPGGADNNPGTLLHPFRTPSRARDAVRDLRRSRPGMSEPVTILFRGGRYELAEPLTLGPEDGGTTNSPTVYAAYPGESPVFSGGTRLSFAVSPRNSQRWVAELPQGKAVWQLWIGNVRQPQARLPEKGYFRVLSVPEAGPETPWNEGQSTFRYDPSMLRVPLDPSGVEAVVMNRWTDSHLPVTGIDPGAALVRCDLRSVYRLEPDDPYYLLNVREALDRPGEWLVDHTQRVIDYVPRPRERPQNADAVVPRLSQLLVIQGNPGSGKYVEYLRFKGITFSHTEWRIPASENVEMVRPGTGGFGQAAVGLPAVIQAAGMRFSSITQCTVSHAGTYAVALLAGCSFDTIAVCTFTDLGGGGVKIGETRIPGSPALATHSNVVANNEISHGGLMYHSAVGIWIGQSPRNLLFHNHIHDFFYSGISIGWTWGYGPATASGNLVELNHIHHIGVRSDGDGPILSDMGGIYTLGAQTGTRIRRNVFHDISARVYGGWGIYPDEGSTGIRIEDNIVYRTSHGGFHQHYGKENVVRNNIFAFGNGHQVMRDHHEPHTSFAFERNIVLWDSGPMFAYEDIGWNMVFDRNLYWRTDGRDRMTGAMDFNQWRSTGMDTGSVFADPRFQDPRNGDFRLDSRSPALTLGFKPIPVDAVLDHGPLPLVAETVSPLPATRRFLYNNDGTNILMSSDSLTLREVYGRIDPLVAGGITTFLHNVNIGQTMGYPSAAGEMYCWEPPAGKNLEGWDLLGRRMNDNLVRMLRDSLDPVGVVVNRSRLRGMESFLTFRMNELHDVDRPGSPLLSRFWRDHPLFRVGGYEGWGAYALNYANPAVRDYFFALLSEVCGRYDMDGLELDFMRFPYYFPFHPDSMVHHTKTMTEFVERVRRMTDGLASARGRPLMLAARVPSSLKGCAHVGLDPAGWCRRGLVDFLTVAPFLSTETDIPVREFKAACGAVPVYTGMEYTVGARMMTREEKRAASALLHAAGGDGIYLFNYFVAWDAGLQADTEVLRDLSNPDSLHGKDKLYTLAAARYPVPGVSLPAQLPLFLRPGERARLSLRTHEEKRPASCTLRIECENDISPGSMAIRWNGVLLSGGSTPSTPMLFPQPVEYRPAPLKHSVECSLDPALLREENFLEVQVEEASTVWWVYLAVRHRRD